LALANPQRLFAELLQTQGQGRPSREHPSAAPKRVKPQDLYREVLLTYRVVFGQDKKSWKAWRRYYSKEIGRFNPETADPLLKSLCGKDYRDESTYSDIQAPDIGQQYNSQDDFPFFGDRLIKIQQFVLKKNPSDWKTLWNDRRDLRKLFLRF
jgi:hypothetical protein